MFGFNVITDPSMVIRKQHRFPRSKKRRIRRKWAKRRENYRWFADETVYRIGGILKMHPSIWERMKKQIQEQQEVI